MTFLFSTEKREEN